MEIISKNLSDTKKIAGDILRQAFKKENRPIVLALSGDLGAGKTAFTKALARELGIKETITSPTFLLMRFLDLPKTIGGISQLVHIDAYRLDSAKELLDLEFGDVLEDKNNIVVIEWPEKLKKYLPKYTIYINFEIMSATERKITML